MSSQSTAEESHDKHVKGSEDSQPRGHLTEPNVSQTSPEPVKPSKDDNGEQSRRSLDTLSGFSASSVEDNRTGRPFGGLQVPYQRHASRSPGPPKSRRERFWEFWQRSKGVTLVLLAQFFGALMNALTRMLETSGGGMDPMQILFARMSITSVLCFLYMWWKDIPDYPLGKKGVRLLLAARGLTGFFGVCGMYYSLLYLPMAEATVLTFLAPIVTCWACSFILREPFTRTEQIAAAVSLAGVILIARPTSLFASGDDETGKHSGTGGNGGFDGAAPANGTEPAHGPYDLDQVTPTQRLAAVGIAMIGVLGASGAYTTIRWIGQRAHPLLSVNYFAVWCTLVSFFTLLIVPSMSFKLPEGATEWGYLVFLGICGFIMQFLLTAGLAAEKSSRATNMVYMQMLFALAFDKLIWGTTPGAISVIGSSMILGAALYVALLPKDTRENKSENEGSSTNATMRDEERGLVEGMDEGDDRDDDHDTRDDEGGSSQEPLRGVQEVQLRTLRH